MPRRVRGRSRWLRCSGRGTWCGGGITVGVRGGDYLLPEGLRFGAGDGGTPEAPVT